MTTQSNPMIERKADLDKNPTGTSLKVKEQLQREKNGRYVRANNNTLLFVPDGQDVAAKVSAFLKKI